MKKLLSTMTILMAITMITMTSLAGGFAGQQQPGKPEPRELPEKPDPYEYFNVGCSALFQSKTSTPTLNDPESWYFHGYIKNTTGKVLPKGAMIVYNFSSNQPGYFQTNSGGVPKLGKTLYLTEALAVNAELFIGGMTFVSSKNPIKINGTAKYCKKK
jgi:hypothetical protein